jgi:hypothetical protein
MRQYSMAVAPHSSSTNRANIRRMDKTPADASRNFPRHNG